jgi:hypothetical protein
MSSRVWTEATRAARKRAYRYCRGCYQRNVVAGIDNVSGSTLKGRARDYGDLYARSRSNLFARLRKAGFEVRVETRDHNALVLVLEYPRRRPNPGPPPEPATTYTDEHLRPLTEDEIAWERSTQRFEEGR